MMTRFLLFFGLLAAVNVQAEPLPVVTLSTVLTEVAEKVGGDKVRVIGLLEPGVDPHNFEPKPSDVAKVAGAKLILASGRNLEGYLTKLKESSATQGVLVEVGNRLPGLEAKHDHDHGHSHGHDHGDVDPHWWHAVPNLVLAANVVRDELIKLDPANAVIYRKNAENYAIELDALQKWVRVKLAELPRNQRNLVTSHDAFGYFAREYGFTVFGIDGVTKESQPTNRELVKVIDQVKKQKVKAIFTEVGANPKITEEIARSTGVKIYGSLLADGLGTGDEDTYEGMIKSNVTTIVNGLK